MADISFLAALVAGVVSFLSPCVLPLVPPYLVYLAGASLERMAGGEAVARARTDTVIASICFVLGFTTVFVALGASATAIGGLIRAWSGTLATIAGVVIIIMGLHFLGVTRLAFLMQEKRVAVSKPVSLWGAYVMGLAFAFGWTPCIGPILGAILTVGAASATVADGVLLLAVYSLGLGVPFLLAAMFTDALTVRLRAFGRIGRVLRILAGGVMMLMGVAMVTGQLSAFSFWLLENFPVLARIG